MSISPIAALVGVQAAAQVLQTGISSLSTTFEQLLGQTPTDSVETSDERSGAQGAPASARSRQLDLWANRQALEAQLQRIGTRIREALQNADVPFEQAIDVRVRNGRLSIDAADNPLPAQLETQLVTDQGLLQSLEDLARRLPGQPAPLTLHVTPNGNARLAESPAA